MFNFSGELETSKSWMNRALIIQSFDFDQISLIGNSSSLDVILLKKALADFKLGSCEFYAGLGGTTFRFLALRISRSMGSFLIKADSALLSRPQQELIEILTQLGVKAWLGSEGLFIESQGWQEPKSLLKISTNQSSQFLSAVLLNSIDLSFDLHIKIDHEIVSVDYYKYSRQILEKSEINILEIENSLFIKKNQKLKKQILYGELDVSSAFSLITAAVIGGQVEIKNWNNQTIQPDIEFLKFFEKMNINLSINNNILKIAQQNNIQPLTADLSTCPDLFPVLSVLCAFAAGESHLYGAPQLKFKESDRILKTAELLTKCGFICEPTNEGIKIQGRPHHAYSHKMNILFNPEHDHRMAMAAALMKLKKFPVQIADVHVINKSYPQFYQHIGLNL